MRALGSVVINGGSLAAATAEEDASCLAKAACLAKSAILAISLSAFAFAFAVATAVDDAAIANEKASAVDDLVDARKGVVCILDPVLLLALWDDIEVVLDSEEVASVRLSNVGKARSKGEVA